MQKKNAMGSNNLLDPYTEVKIERGRGVTCHMTTSGLTICDAEKRSYGASILITVLGLIIVTLLFCLKIEITFVDGSYNQLSPSNALRDAGIVIAILSIFVGVVLGILYTANRHER